MWNWLPNTITALGGVKNPWIYVPAGIVIVLIGAAFAWSMVS
ncbi:MAG: hypothetical protein AAF709_23360 [Pseudomonadota bacterium]